MIAKKGKSKQHGKPLPARADMRLLAAVMLAGITLAACGKEETKPADTVPKAPDPVTLTVATPAIVWTEAEFNNYLVEPVRAKYPHITLKRIDTAAKGTTINELVAAGQIPDVYAVQQANMGPLMDLELAYDATELLKKHKIELGRIQPELLEAPKQQFGLGYLPGLPVYQSNWVLAYNKNVFDKFGVAYPKDGMTWPQIADLAKKLTRTDQGVQYYGLSMARTYSDAYKQLSLPFADFTTNKPLLQSEGWKELMQFWNDVNRAQGSPPQNTDWNKAWNEKRIAMRTIQTAIFQEFLADKDLDFDIVTYPQYEKAKGYGLEMNALWWTVTKQSANKEAAAQVLALLLSDEIQTRMTRGMRLTVLSASAIQNQTGADVAGTQGKNVSAFAKLKTPPPIRYGKLLTPFLANMNAAYNAVLFQNVDVNTALRDADEKMGKDIQAELKK